jgi:hypothetical protein
MTNGPITVSNPHLFREGDAVQVERSVWLKNWFARWLKTRGYYRLARRLPQMRVEIEVYQVKAILDETSIFIDDPRSDEELLRAKKSD